MKITLTKSHGYYRSEKHNVNLCFSALRYLFELDDLPKKIDVIASRKRPPKSYLVTKWQGKFGSGFAVKLSNGRIYDNPAGAFGGDLYNLLPEQFYVKVEA